MNIGMQPRMDFLYLHVLFYIVSQATPSNHCEREGHMRVVSAEFNDYITYYCEILAFAKPSLDGCGFRAVHILAIRTAAS